MQSLWLGAGHLAGMLEAPTVDAEVCPDVSCAYHAHAGARFLAYECALGLNFINPLYFVLLTAF